MYSCTIFCLFNDIVGQMLYNGDTSKQYFEEAKKLKKACAEEVAKLSQGTRSAEGNDPPQWCPPKWVPYLSSCYFFSNDYGNWKQGKVRCEKKYRNSKYVKITSQEEDTFLRNFVRSKSVTEYAAQDYWIGGTDASEDGVFIWEGYSEEFAYTNWGPGNPDRVGTSDCVILFRRSDYKWHDTSCSNNNSYICEIEF